LPIPFFPIRETVKAMKNQRPNRWFWGGFLAFLIWMIPLSAFCEMASIQGVHVKWVNGTWNINFHVENCFTEKMEEAIQTGIKTIFTFYLQVYQKRVWWKDRRVASVQFHRMIQYDPIRGEYQVSFSEKGASLTTKNLEEAKKWMAKVEAMEMKPFSDLKPGVPTYLRIKAGLDPVKLPLHLEYLFFFVSLWDFETEWHIEPLASETKP
jgi:hypothetical protein